MTHQAQRRDDLASLISDMEPGIRDLVRWAGIVSALGSSDHFPLTCLTTLGDAMHAQARATEADWERCFELSGVQRRGER